MGTALNWQYAELPSSTSDAVLCTVLVCKIWVIYPKIGTLAHVLSRRAVYRTRKTYETHSLLEHYLILLNLFHN